MFRARRVVVCLIGVLLTLGVAGPGPTQATPGGAPPGAGRQFTVTLVTGHTVRMTDRGDAVLLNPDGSIVDGYHGYLEHGDRFLIPNEAYPYLSAGLLDKELFNLTDLVEKGYADRPLPLIVTYQGVRAQRAPVGATLARELPSINGLALSVDRGSAAAFWDTVAGPAKLSGGIEKIWLDGRVSASLDVSVPQVGAPTAWQQGYDGTGVTVAVLDTGVDATHPDLTGKVTETQNFSDAATAEDKQGHGTHVASTVAGTGAASGGARKGVAPGAKIVSGKVLNDNGAGALSWIIAGMEWAASRAPIVSMSLGGDPGNNDGTDPMSRALNALTASTGTLFVVAAGNHPPGRPAVSAPAVADAALAVGAVDRNDALAPFSNYGPREGDSAIKPEITAPGTDIGAARAAGTSIGRVIDDHYTRLNGTSMATPHVSGAAAILAQRNRSWHAAELKSALMATAKPTDGLTAYQQGTGRLDVAAAITSPIQVDQTNLSLGRFNGPYGSLPPVERTLTYRNTGTAPVTLDLSAAARRADGSPADPNALRLSQSSLNVPAGETAAVTLTLDPNKGELGLYDGALVATPRGGGPALRAAIGFHKEVRHKITLRGTARDGRPATRTPASVSGVTAWNLTTFERVGGIFVDGLAELSVPPGNYLISAGLETLDVSGQVPIESTRVVRDDVPIDGPVTLDLDARGGKEIRAKVGEETEPVLLLDFLSRSIDGLQLIEQSGYSRTVDRLYAVPTPPVRRGELELTTWMPLRKPLLRMKVRGHDLTLAPKYLGWASLTQPRLDGRRVLPVVFVGTGTPEEIARQDVTGKLALIEQSAEVEPDQQVRNAAAGKAAAAMVYAAKPGLFNDNTQTDLPIPGMAVSHEDGRRLVELLKRDRIALDVRATLASPFVYDLLIPFRNRIPDNLTIQPRRRDLAVVHNEIHSVRPGQVGMVGSTYFPLPNFAQSVVGVVPFPLEQDRYALPGKDLFGLVWDGEDAPMMTADHQPAAGRRATVSWFKAPLAPGVSGAWPPASRVGDTIWLAMNEFVDAEPNHVYAAPAEQSAARIYRNGALVAEAPHAVDAFEIGTEQPAIYRVELDIDKGRPDWRVATSSKSAWTFRSARPADGVTENLQVLRAQWDLGLGLDNTARADSRFDLRLRTGTQPGATPVRVKAATAWASFDDGKTWQRVDNLRPKDGGVFDGSIRHPKRSQTSGFVSLRLDVTDVAGNRFEQTLIRAYELR